MGFNNYHSKPLGAHRFELVVRSDNGLIKVLRTDVDFGIQVLEENAKLYAKEMRENGAREIYLDYYNNEIESPNERRYRTEVL